MNWDFLFLTYESGLLTVDIPFDSPYIRTTIVVWLIMFVVNLVLGVIKRIPFL